MKTLVIDNYDSFTYNLVHMLAEINQDEPVVVRNDEFSWSEVCRWKFDNIVVSPGPGRPSRTEDFGISKDAICHAKVPLLGVCLGHQGIAEFAGGSVDHAPAPMHGRISSIMHNGTGLFVGLPQPLNVARYHSLVAVRPLPLCLTETAWTSDGLVMGLARLDRPQWGVQFHPESIVTDHGRGLLQNFRDLAYRSGGSRSVPVTHLPTAERALLPEARDWQAFWREIPYPIDCESAFLQLFGNSSTAFWLDSSLVGPDRSQWSYFGDGSGPNASLMQYDSAAKMTTVIKAGQKSTDNSNVWNYLSREIRGFPATPPPCPFVGGNVGWFGYELRSECGSPTRRRAATPDALFIRVDRFIAVDHISGRSFVVAVDHPNEASRAQEWVTSIIAQFHGLKPAKPIQFGKYLGPVQFILHRDRTTYLSDIEHCLDWIVDGETYQVCLTNDIWCTSRIDPIVLYRVMRQINPAPYAAFLRWPGGTVLSASPERFLSLDRFGRVETKPIKGTIKRDKDLCSDLLLAEKLRKSEKDRAENVMIVDLLRNDLSRVCEPGSVIAPKLFAVETYATVHQLVSTVRGQLAVGRSPIDLVRATFPGGSMTGAPKIRTMELIDSLERRARGIYSGALGWIGDDGALDLSIVIRAIVSYGGYLSMGVGGGIVAQSTPEGEFDEMLLKAQASIEAIVRACTGGFESGSYRVFGDEVDQSRGRVASR